MKFIVLSLVLLAPLAACSRQTSTATYPSASPAYPNAAQCEAAGRVWDAVSRSCSETQSTSPLPGTTGPTGTPGERQP